jgi:hypothetical protein
LTTADTSTSACGRMWWKITTAAPLTLPQPARLYAGRRSIKNYLIHPQYLPVTAVEVDQFAVEAPLQRAILAAK